MAGAISVAAPAIAATALQAQPRTRVPLPGTAFSNPVPTVIAGGPDPISVEVAPDPGPFEPVTRRNPETDK